MSPTAADRIHHIAEAIANIRDLVAGQTYESFANSLATGLAVERLLEVISEASRNIPSDLKAKSLVSTGDPWRISETGYAMPITGSMRVCYGA